MQNFSKIELRQISYSMSVSKMKILVVISENNNPRQLHSFFSDSEATTHFFLGVGRGLGLRREFGGHFVVRVRLNFKQILFSKLDLDSKK